MIEESQDNKNIPLLVIAGPTATGKSDLSLCLAERFNGEIISGDSMQVYCGMDIGTAKLPPEKRRGIPHYLLDVRQPWEGFSVAEFRELAKALIVDITSRGKLPILTGGTGLYLDSLLRPYHFTPESETDPEIRLKLKDRLEQEGRDALWHELAKLDPETAQRVHPNDTHRLLRALEVFYGNGSRISELRYNNQLPPPYHVLMVGLTAERQLLYQRIEKRVDQMMELGLLTEVQNLLAAGVSPEAQSMQGIGYRQLAEYCCGNCSLEDAVEMIKRDTRRYAKRQMTWFRRNNAMIWFDISRYREQTDLVDAVCVPLVGWLKGEQYETAGITGTIF